jgi:hypothetical protein
MVNAVSGIATFDDLILTAAGSTTLAATSAGPTGTSSAIDVESTTNIYAAYPPASGSAWTAFTTYVVPHINGVTLNVDWDSVDAGTSACSEATTCSWTTIDSTIETYTALQNHSGAYLTVGLLVSPASDKSPNSATPGYVFTPSYATGLSSADQDIAACPSYAGDGGTPIASGDNGVWNEGGGCWSSGGTCTGNTDISGIPVTYEIPFKTAYEHFIDEVVKHYSVHGSGDGPTIAPSIAYIRFGTVNGGESFPFCNADWPDPTGLAGDPNTDFSYANFVGSSGPPLTGYTATLDNAIHTAISFYGSIVPIVQSTEDPDFVTSPIHEYSDGEAALAEYYGIGFGEETLDTNDPDAYALAQAGGSETCTEDWCANFNTYATSGPFLYLQTTPPSSQTIFNLATSGNSIASCTGTTCTATCDTSVPCTFWNGSATYTHPAFGYININATSNTSFNNPPWIYDTSQFSGSNQIGFTFDTTVNSTATVGNVWAPDLLPLTYPFAVQQYATALETNMCDLYFAYGAGTVGSCSLTGPASGLGSAANYASTISSISRN